MNRNWTKWVAILVAFAFVGWLGAGIFTGCDRSDNTPKVKVEKDYEPTFKKEGELWVLDGSTNDTVVALDVEYAESEEEIQFGMMYRKHMDPTTGMLFFMPVQRMQSFWMRNTYVPLDIIYINDSLKVVSIQKNAQPLTETSRPSDGPALYVLEVKGGLSDQKGIKKGDQVHWRDL
ncbi:MAG: DUF192 domain-containing protein [Bacteroidota bacterium]|nr:DUF192 domain-containing protein [Bacteroidota bacterium]